ncbi:MAG: type II toxin-antitoxin system HicA family toxin [Desulfuromonadales bacterium]|nr:type II toxin-antitoxin system HicA family toxin [Desulfuromonadales bacterium]
MPKLYSSRYIIAVLLRHGFYEVSQSGSHKKFYNGASTVIVPAGKREIPIGTFLSIVRQSGLSRNDFES